MKKKKPMKIILISVPILLLICLGIVHNANNSSENSCTHEIKKIVSAELVSQEKPLVFFDLMEQPTIEGIKVKLAYEDGSSEVVDAYEATEEISNDFEYAHRNGMFFDIRIFHGTFYWAKPPLLHPGMHRIAMYCVDTNYTYGEIGHWELSHNPDESGEDEGLAYCMVDVYVQTGEEYLAEHNPPLATVTESGKDMLSLKNDESSLIQLLAQESGTYLLQVDGDYRLNEREYSGSGTVFLGPAYSERNPKDYSNIYMDYYAQLNANEPLILRVKALETHKASLKISLTRLPEVTIAVGETIKITQPTALRIRDYDSTKTQKGSNRNFYGSFYCDGDYILAGDDYDHYALQAVNHYQGDICLYTGDSDGYGYLRLERLHAVWDGHVIIPQTDKGATVTLRLADTAIPQKEIRLEVGERVRLDETITTDFRGSIGHEIAPGGIFTLQSKDEIAYLYALQKGEATLTLGDSPAVLGKIKIIVE